MAGREDFEERKKAKIDRLESAAYKARKGSESKFEASHEAMAGVPLGQPNIRGALTGMINRSNSAARAGMKLSDKADYLESKLEAVENNNTISSDDPNSIQKLQEKIDTLTKEKEFYKAVNAYYRKNGTVEGFEGLSDKQVTVLNENAKYCLNCGKPFASFTITNLNARIKQAQERLEKIKETEQMPAELIEYGFGEIESNSETNRCTILFYKQMSDEIIQNLKMHGYKFAYSEKKWQRLRNPSAWRLTKRLAEEINKETMGGNICKK